MKLLSKQEISRQKSSERKTEIDEGVKLARKIDSLRETASVEELKLAKFREASLKLLKEEIQILLDEKIRLTLEIGNLNIQKDTMVKNLKEIGLINK